VRSTVIPQKTLSVELYLSQNQDCVFLRMAVKVAFSCD